MKILHEDATGHGKRYTRTFVVLMMTWLLASGPWPAGLATNEAWADESSVSAGTVIALHVSSFADEKRAQHEVTRLKELGHTCMYQAEDVSGRNWFRVYLTGFDSMFQARRTGKTMRSDGKITYYHAVELNLPVSPKDKPAVAESKTEPAAFQKDQYGANVHFIPYAGPVLAVPEQSDDVSGTTGLTAGYVPKKEIASPERHAATSRGDRYAATTKSACVGEQVMAMPEKPGETAVIEKAGNVPVSKNGLKIVQGQSAHKTRKVKNGQPLYPFSFSVRAGGYFFLNADDFKLEGIHDYDDVVWDISDDMLPMLAAVAEYHPTEHFSIEGSAEKLFSDQLDVMFLSLDPKLSVRLSNGVSAYITCGIVYGKLYWDSAPGKFDCGLGMDAGAGIMTSLFSPHITLGCDLHYRSIEFDYKMPDDDDIVDEPEEKALNLSGFFVTGNVSYHF